MTAPSPKVEQRHQNYARKWLCAANPQNIDALAAIFAAFERDLLTPSGDAEGRARELLAQAYADSGEVNSPNHSRAIELRNGESPRVPGPEGIALRAITAALTSAPQPLREALEAARSILMNSGAESGYCVCGDPVASHSFGSGHSPVDAHSYHAARVVQQIDQALAMPGDAK